MTTREGSAARGQTVREAYELLAAAYDELTAVFRYERWLAGLERLAIEHGLAGRRVLDVACGTGKSFLPLLGRGYEVTCCDVSAAMLERAAAKAPGVRLIEADMRRLPALGEFDLVVCLDDALNYLQQDDELAGALRCMRRALARRGVALWDLNTLAMYRGDFAATRAVESDGRMIVWRGLTAVPLAAGERAEAIVDIFEAASGGCWRHARSEHRQRHWPAETVHGAAGRAGLRVLAVLGQHRGARIEPGLDEEVHTKAVFVACRDDRPTSKEVLAMRIGSP